MGMTATPETGERTYRRRAQPRDLVSFSLQVKQTDLWISAERDLSKEALDLVFQARAWIEAYIADRPEFATSLIPIPEDPHAPVIVKEMMAASSKVGVGPMAAVAGTIAEFVGRGLGSLSSQVIVENGGDLFIAATRPVTVSIFAGASSLSERIGISVPNRQMPLGVSCSSKTVGHSLSLGMADAVCILSPSAALADAAATALGNRIHDPSHLDKAGAWASEIQGLLGGVVVFKDRLAAWGDVELVSL
jgi:hypothetical protein